MKILKYTEKKYYENKIKNNNIKNTWRTLNIYIVFIKLYIDISYTIYK